ncbi:hypothetical protein K439DRAFT_1665085 [Ramaria rubella]|nr:hypothetical protein K439DRAFT_1665085 [Ramaria rubella]
MLSHLWNVSVQSAGKALPCSKDSTGHADSVETVVFDIQAKMEKYFLLVLERGTDTADCYVVVLLDGITCDHFLIKATCRVATSWGWTKSKTVIYPYWWTFVGAYDISPVGGDRQNAELGLAGHITLRFHHLPPGLCHLLRHETNFLPSPSLGKISRPRMSCYAVLHSDPIRLPLAKHKTRLPAKTVQLKMPVPYYQIHFRYNDEIRKLSGSSVRLANKPEGTVSTFPVNRFSEQTTPMEHTMSNRAQTNKSASYNRLLKLQWLIPMQRGYVKLLDALIEEYREAKSPEKVADMIADKEQVVAELKTVRPTHNTLHQ